MAYVIYNKESTLILRARARSVGCYVTNYKSEAAAKAALTRLAKKGLLGDKVTQEPTKANNWDRKTVPHVKEDFAIAEAQDFFANIEKKETRIGVAHAHGQKFEVGVNTSWTSGPWSETYHCS